LPRRIVVVEYDPAWSLEFEVEGERIYRALGELVVKLHHIGSTAIPGIHAKPIIDFLMEVADIDRLDEKSSAMEELGYEAKGEFGIPGRRYFRKNNASGERTHQVHAFEVESPHIERHLAFRDYMIAHPEEAQEYGKLKQRLARKHPNDIQRYMDGKEPFIKDCQARAIEWRRLQKTD
jgi:GrpB-like predicted nucleotidyltransferase (UPF0157 family)